jgi:hypothetical protein
MKYLPVKLILCALLIASCSLFILPLVAQDSSSVEELDLPSLDESQFDQDNATPDQSTTPPPDLGPEPDLGSEPEYSSFEGDAPVQNAIIEGVQLSAEPGDKEDEKVVTCYFIFRDKPSSYFYEVKMKEQRIIFEFNDTKASAAPVPSVAEAPITGFTIEQRKVDVNKDVRGLKPEYHTQIRVVFSLDQIPVIHVSDEYNIISFSYKWTTNYEKIEQYIVKDNTKKIMLWSTASVGGVGAGILGWYLFFKPQPQEQGPIPYDDLPDRPNK